MRAVFIAALIASATCGLAVEVSPAEDMMLLQMQAMGDEEPEPVEVPEVSEAQDEANEEVQEEVAEAAVKEEVDDFQETPQAKAADAFIKKNKDEAEVAEALEDAKESPEAKAADAAIKQIQQGKAPDADPNAMPQEEGVGLAETEREKGILKEMVAKAKKKGMLQEADKAIQNARKDAGRDQHMGQHSVAKGLGINFNFAKNIDLGVGAIGINIVFTAVVDPKNCKVTVHGSGIVSATIKTVWGSTALPGTPVDLLAGQIPTVAVGGGAIVLMFAKGPGNAVVTLATDTGGCTFTTATVSVSVCVGSSFCTPTQKVGTFSAR